MADLVKLVRRFVLCDLLDLHKWQRWDVDRDYQTCGRCDMTIVSTVRRG